VTVDDAGTSAPDGAAADTNGLDPSQNGVAGAIAGSAGPGGADGEIRERAASVPPGSLMLALHSVLLIVGITVLSVAFTSAGRVGLITTGATLVLLAIVVAVGLISVAPGDAQVIQLYGRYRGTIRGGGMFWVPPGSKRRKISTKIRSHQTEVAKVNDADGNPIEIAAVVVWQVKDTAKAVFGVDDLTSFVALQAETTVRQIANLYPYDDHGEGRLSLRGATEDVTARLADKLAQRVAPAGVKIIEVRLIRLAYAQEIAHAMLRRQQAGAMVAARQKIVDGAVGMVESALARLDADGLVDLDPERKASMVSNMLVVLCSDHPAQPVVNTGTLYQ
jgi:regulator of protease activity HflC (stomatin/prohibitin superfamily)